MSAVWAGVFRRDFLLTNSLRFNTNMIAQEDTLFYWDMSLCNPAQYKYEGICYLYRQRANSVMHTKNLERSVKYYYAMREMLSVYQRQLEIVPADKRMQLLEKIHHSQENVASTLFAVTDTKFVKEELHKIKREGLYPYKFRKAALHGKKTIRKVLFYLLPIEPIGWMMHFAYKVYFKRKYS